MTYIYIKKLDGRHHNSNTDHSFDSWPVYSQLAPSRKKFKSAIQLMYGYAMVLSHEEKFSLIRSPSSDIFLIFFEINFVQKLTFFFNLVFLVLKNTFLMQTLH